MVIEKDNIEFLEGLKFYRVKDFGKIFVGSVEKYYFKMFCSFSLYIYKNIF